MVAPLGDTAEHERYDERDARVVIPHHEVADDTEYGCRDDVTEIRLQRVGTDQRNRNYDRSKESNIGTRNTYEIACEHETGCRCDHARE